jgi:hypothetical protein
MTWWSRLVEFGSRKVSRSRSGLPTYRAIVRKRPGKVRRDFSDLENSPEIDRLQIEFESELLSLPRRPTEDEPLLTSLNVPPSGLFTVAPPNCAPFLPTFSTPLRAGEYARIHAGQLQLGFLCSNPKEFVKVLGGLRRYGKIQSFALDPCPHCKTVTVIDTNSMLTTADVLKVWAVHKSFQLARESLYFARAQEAAARGDLQEAKETALHAIQHVTADSARLHLQLGKIALSLKEKEVFREAVAFLKFLQAKQFVRQLLAAQENSKIQC